LLETDGFWGVLLCSSLAKGLVVFTSGCVGFFFFFFLFSTGENEFSLGRLDLGCEKYGVVGGQETL